MSEIAILKSTLVEHSDWVYSVAFHPTLPLLATGSYDKTAKLWRFSLDGSTATCVATLRGHSDYVISVAFHPTAPLLATSSKDNTAKLWRFSPDGSRATNMLATCVATLAGHHSVVWSIAFHPTLPLLATGSYDKTAKLWRISRSIKTVTCVETLEGHSNYVTSVAFHSTLPFLATASADGSVKLWRISRSTKTVDCVATLREFRTLVYSVAFHPTLPLLATGSSDKTAKLWRFSPDGSAANSMSANYVAILVGHRERVDSVAFYPTLPLLATASADKTVKLWIFSPDGSRETNMSARCVATLVGHRSGVYSVAFHQTLPLLATSSIDFTAKLWELNLGNNRIFSDSSSNLPSLTSSRNNWSGRKIIRIPLKLRQLIDPDNKSCINYKPLYDQLMLFDLSNPFKFDFEGETGQDASGLTKIVFGFLLPVYTNKFFTKAEEFILLKKDVDMALLDQHTNQIIKLAKAAYSQIYLQIDPKLIGLLLSPDLKKYFSNNKKNNFTKMYEFINQVLNTPNYDELNNNSSFLRINKNKNEKNRVINLYKKTQENKIKTDLLSEIRLRRFLADCGFSSWNQVENMRKFINKFWNSDKLRYRNNRQNVELPLFSCELQYDIVSFTKRLKIEISNGSMLDLKNIPQDLFQIYPAFKPLLDYILNPDKNADINRKKFVKYVSGTEYTLRQLIIKLWNAEIRFKISNGTKLYELPFYPHTCFSVLDLFKTPSSGNYQEVWNVARINEEITKGSSSTATRN